MEMTVHTAKPYEILLERGLLSRAGEECAKLFAPGARAMIISDSNVYPLFGEKVATSLREAGFRVFSSPPGSRASSSLLWKAFTGHWRKTTSPAAILW